MRDILKIMRFDYLTAKPYALVPAVIIVAFCFALSLFFSPLICAYITFGAMMFVIPLQGAAVKGGFSKIYGILPVSGKNITRGRFVYIFALHFIAELVELALAALAFNLKLNRLLPNQSSELIQMVNNGFSDGSFIVLVNVGVFALFCLLFAYMEMMGQIFGRENELKIIIVTLGGLTALVLGIFALADKGIIPTLKFPTLPQTLGGKIILGAAVNIVMLGICMLFGEITANKLAKREL